MILISFSWFSRITISLHELPDFFIITNFNIFHFRKVVLLGWWVMVRLGIRQRACTFLYLNSRKYKLWFDSSLLLYIYIDRISILSVMLSVTLQLLHRSIPIYLWVDFLSLHTLIGIYNACIRFPFQYEANSLIVSWQHYWVSKVRISLIALQAIIDFIFWRDYWGVSWLFRAL